MRLWVVAANTADCQPLPQAVFGDQIVLHRRIGARRHLRQHG
jgi:hypothetical protein